MKQKVQPIRSATLFEMGKLDKAADLMSSLQMLRPYSEPDLYLGTSAFTASVWQGSFYPKGMQPHEYPSHYAQTFRTVEVRGNTDLPISPSFDTPGIRLDQSVLRTRIFLRTLVQIH